MKRLSKKKIKQDGIVINTIPQPVICTYSLALVNKARRYIPSSSATQVNQKKVVSVLSFVIICFQSVPFPTLDIIIPPFFVSYCSSNTCGVVGLEKAFAKIDTVIVALANWQK